MNKSWLIIIGCAIILFVAGAVQFLFPRTAVSPSTTDTNNELLPAENSIATSTGSTQVKANVSNSTVQDLISIAKGDVISSWNFKGAYTDNPELIAKAEAEIKRLSDLIGKGTYTNMTLYVSIANQYGLLGDGKQEYNYLNRAIETGGSTTGLPWHNLGVLMERLGAFQTARVAYERAAVVQPELKQWHYAYLAFLTARMKDNVADIEKAFTAAIKNLGQDSDILQLYSEWKQS
ncbi:MAG: hypothetical protein V1711_00765 [bacterium]